MRSRVRFSLRQPVSCGRSQAERHLAYTQACGSSILSVRTKIRDCRTRARRTTAAVAQAILRSRGPGFSLHGDVEGVGIPRRPLTPEPAGSTPVVATSVVSVGEGRSHLTFNQEIDGSNPFGDTRWDVAERYRACFGNKRSPVRSWPFQPPFHPETIMIGHRVREYLDEKAARTEREAVVARRLARTEAAMARARAAAFEVACLGSSPSAGARHGERPAGRGTRLLTARRAQRFRVRVPGSPPASVHDLPRPRGCADLTRPEVPDRLDQVGATLAALRAQEVSRRHVDHRISHSSLAPPSVPRGHLPSRRDQVAIRRLNPRVRDEREDLRGEIGC